ncbi:MAG: hypothetical protein NC395_07290 [Prevotella sp.]|nr:hypothetical protein [Prevotella sp.]
MSAPDEFKKYRELAGRCRNCDPFKNPQEAAALLNLLASFLDKLIAQKEAEREEVRQTDAENLAAAIGGLTEVIAVLTERVGNVPAAAAPKARKSPPKKKFVPPTADEVGDYCKERKNGIDPQYFVDYYSARDWIAGKKKMSDWKAAVRTWERNGIGQNGAEAESGGHSYDLDALVEHAMNSTPTLKK